MKEGLKAFVFYKIYIMAFCSMFFGMVFISLYKIFGLMNDIDDLTLTVAGTIGAVGGSISKFACGILMDKLGFKVVYGIILCI